MVEFQKQRGPYRPEPDEGLLGRVFHTRKVAHTVDYAAEPSPGPPARLGGARSTVAVPMLKDDELVGAIVIYRTEVRPFTDKQIALVTNFAAQAVIAIENTRLLNELRQRTDDLGEALEQQTATSEVLKVISSSRGELAPVFGTMLAKATTICEASYGTMWLREGDGFRTGAIHGDLPAAFIEQWQREPIYRPGPDVPLSRAVATRGPAQVADLKDSESYRRGDPLPTTAVDVAGIRSLLVVPMLKEGEPIGALAIYRREVRPFTDKHIELLTNFAAQAVIAIENTRLLSELRESLAQQTATSEVLQVISSSPGELQPVFQAMLENATRICEAKFGNLFLYDGTEYRSVATHGVPPAWAEFLQRNPVIRPDPNVPLGRVAMTKQVAHIADIRMEQAYIERFPPLVAVAESGGARTLLVVPMLKEDELVGAIGIYRQEVRPFTDKQIELVQNFAAQAVIAIENTRLLNELRKSLQQQTATADVLKVISRSAFDLQVVLDTLIESAARLCRADKSAIRMMKGGFYHNVASYGYSPEQIEWLKQHPYVPDRGSVVGQVMLDGKLVHVADAQVGDVGRASALGVRTLLGVPLLRERAPIGALMLMRNIVQPFTEQQVALVTTFADQAVIAIENVRLFDEIQDKSRQLAEASQHKSQFLANMSHELRTPLNAILGYAELILDNVYGDTPDKMREVLDRIQRNGKHLLGLINDVLDLSKIEAGQLNLSLADYSLKEVVQSVYSAVEALAKEKQIALKVEVPPHLPAAHGDERKLTQVLLNLVGNAIKFTDTGEVTIKASAANGSFTVAVRDTGPGIAEAEQAKIFEEFQQAELVDHKEERRDWAWTGDCQAHCRVAWGAAVGRVRARGRGRRSLSPCRPWSSNRRGRHEQAHSGGRRSGYNWQILRDLLGNAGYELAGRNGKEGPSSCRSSRAAWWCAPARAALDGYSISVRDDLAAPCMSREEQSEG